MNNYVVVFYDNITKEYQADNIASLVYINDINWNDVIAVFERN